MRTENMKILKETCEAMRKIQALEKFLDENEMKVEA